MIQGIAIVTAGALMTGLLLGWLGGRFLRLWLVLAVAVVLAVLAGAAMALFDGLDFRGSLQAVVFGFSGLAAALGLLVGGLIGSGGRQR